MLQKYTNVAVVCLVRLIPFFVNQTEAAPLAKVKKRKTVKQIIQEKEEKAKETALSRLEESKSAKEVRTVVQ